MTDLSGVLQETIPADGAQGMALAADGDAVLVAAANESAILRIDGATLATHRFSTGVGTCPRDVAETAGGLWFADHCEPGISAGMIGVIDPVTEAVTTGIAIGDRLEASPGVPDILWAGSFETASISSWGAFAYEAVGGVAPSLTLRASTGLFGDLTLAISPDGSRAAMSGNEENRVELFDGDLTTRLGTLAGSLDGNATAFRADGTAAVTGAWRDQLLIYPPGKLAPSVVLNGLKPITDLQWGATNAFVVTTEGSRTSGPLDHHARVALAATEDQAD